MVCDSCFAEDLTRSDIRVASDGDGFGVHSRTWYTVESRCCGADVWWGWEEIELGKYNPDPTLQDTPLLLLLIPTGQVRAEDLDCYEPGDDDDYDDF